MALKKVVKPDEEWRSLLTPEQYRVCRLKETEPAFSGPCGGDHRPGLYHCACCEAPLFSSACRFDSGTGWPSFLRPLSGERVVRRVDKSHGMVRAEVCCAVCDAHLGHVFTDGPAPTGQRWCINSAALRRRPAQPEEEEPAK